MSPMSGRIGVDCREPELRQATAADLESIRLSLSAELGGDYFSLRAGWTGSGSCWIGVVAYERASRLTQNGHGRPRVTSDVALAKRSSKPHAPGGRPRRWRAPAFEHANPLLVGEPAVFRAGAAAADGCVAAIPRRLVGLLERRPDVAAAERRLASANAEVA